ncbi:MAG: RNA polymerase subunit sigma [Candidatus Dojkabacteria bacterium]|nr:MAG: RNA polymerase subunit sigma [Candidatus Dojkabacteria bacterium]BCX13635.1 MAG: RNA polymerase subunit sigma [Candidatus Dojkabacteria bacterium]
MPQDPRIIKVIFEQYFDDIYKFFYFKFLNKEVAEDLTSDTFLMFSQSIHKGVEIESYKYFLYGIAKNLFIKELKKKYKRREINISEIENFEETHVEKFIEFFKGKTPEERIRPFIQKLPKSQREVATLRFLEKMSLQEICKHLGKNMNYVKTTQKRAIKSLKKLIICTPFDTN